MDYCEQPTMDPAAIRNEKFIPKDYFEALPVEPQSQALKAFEIGSARIRYVNVESPRFERGRPLFSYFLERLLEVSRSHVLMAS